MMFAITLGIWSALRLPIAFNKATIGEEIGWISAVFRPTLTSLTVTVKESLVQETLEMLLSFVSGNYIRKKLLRSCVGKAQHIASLVPLVRPFLQELYAALHSDSAKMHSRFGAEVVWTKQVRHALLWLTHLLQEGWHSQSTTRT